MDIQQLEFIRDFEGHFWKFKNHLSFIATTLENPDELTDLTVSYLEMVSNGFEILHEIFNNFKFNVDRIYWSEWKKKYPHLHEDYEKHHKET